MTATKQEQFIASSHQMADAVDAIIKETEEKLQSLRVYADRLRSPIVDVSDEPLAIEAGQQAIEKAGDLGRPYFLSTALRQWGNLCHFATPVSKAE